MKIAQIVCTFSPYKGGMGNAAYQLSNGLSGLGHNVTVFTPEYNKQNPPNPPCHGDFNEFKVVRIQPFLKFGNAAVLSKIGGQLKDFDVIHLHYPFFGTAYFVYKFKKRFPDKKLVITYHMDAIGSGLKGLFFKFYAKILMPKILNSADIITVSSLDYIENSQAKKMFESNKDKFVELPFGVDIERFKPQKKDNDLMSKFGIQPDDKVILFVGGLDKAHYFKGVELLIKAFKMLSEKRGSTSLKRLNLLVVGEGELKDHYQYLVKKLELENKIKFIEVGEYNDLPKYYNLCDLFVLPSINRAEAFGLVLVEAMACGKAILTSNLQGVRTVPVDNKNCIIQVGNVKDLADKIFNLLNNDELRLKIEGEGRKKVEEKYSWHEIFIKLEKIYSSI